MPFKDIAQRRDYFRERKRSERSGAIKTNSEKISAKRCIVCAKEYTPYNSRQKYCSDCRPRAHRLPSMRSHLEKASKRCVVCDKEFTPHNSRHKYCSDCRPRINCPPSKRNPSEIWGVYAFFIPALKHFKVGRGIIPSRLRSAITWVGAENVFVFAYTEIDDDKERLDAELKIKSDLGLNGNGYEIVEDTPELREYLYTAYNCINPINVTLLL